ncbi:MAG TPA: HyaD/HybD family hydrogenase maturation endopeptidase [Spirochaetota bacterium]|nr:HyaD/HybD family hydrogenase maturation endopeptidase [Spirochaetota bacterium]HPJ36979.1 HyaD/HybD family hydrogenase maturation endopeptidase [Spirochaetota bacterium]HPQ51755.1 HyaD/HybD family hydrogenase maturation endopeptidase [Spirochaetota bacterium]
MKKVLVLGIGNILQGDDGLGVHIVNRIEESGISLPDDVEIIDGGTAGFDLLPLMQGRDRIIVVDAMRGEGTPGSIYRFKPENAVETRSGVSLHEVGLMEVIRTLRLLGSNPDIEIIGIIPEDIETTDIKISAAVQNAIPKAIELILDAVAN